MSKPPGGPHDKPRKHARTPLSVLVQYRFDTLDEFLAEYSVDISPGGMFIKTNDPKPLGAVLFLQFSLKDGSSFIEGLAKVVHVTPPPGTAGRPPGMGVEFVSVDDESLALIHRICASRGQGPQD
jgi:molecular chaperone DnaK